MAKVLINRISVQNKLNRALTKKSYQDLAARNAAVRFDQAKRDLIDDFQNHPVTLEIEAGPTAQGGLLERGSLFSFIGFNQSETPTAELRNYLETNIKLNSTPKFTQTKNGLIYSFNVKTPSIEDIYNNKRFSVDWSNKGWIYLIEKGINNFSYYIFYILGFASGASRSGTGLQNTRSKKKRGGKALGIPYISEILNRFISKFSRK